MTTVFEINYRTAYGHYIGLFEYGTQQTGWTEEHPLRLECSGEDFWRVEVNLSDDAKFNYKYGVFSENNLLAAEDGIARTFENNTAHQIITVRDHWQNSSYEDVFHTKLFTESVFKRPNKRLSAAKSVKSKTSEPIVCFRLTCPQIYPKQGVAIIGNIPELGEWNYKKKLVLSDANYPQWETTIKVRELQDIEYKYCIYDLKTGEVLDVEYGNNRYVWGLQKDMTIIEHDISLRRTLPSFKGAGVAIPVFSLRTNDSCGIGEYLDLKKMADWAAKVGLQIIQTLPINDTTLTHTNKDSYPYSPVSVFALHPIYLNIPKMGKLSGSVARDYNAIKEEFNKKDISDYQNVYDAKMKFFKTLFESQKDSLFKTSDYLSFYENNLSWLEPYGEFMSKRDGLPKKFYFFLQYHADKQMAEAVSYAHSIGVTLKGDIPIGIDPHSVDASSYPELFNMNASAGAPPDDFDARGQNWGFPTYNWDAMERDNYSWWRFRLKKMEKYFDAYRIDHILGFFRIWQMRKSDVWGLCGHFSPSIPFSLQDLWNSGIKLDEDRMVKPYIRANFLGEVFGFETDYAKEHFLNTNDGYVYYFKEEFDTPVKVKQYFEQLKQDLTCPLSEQQQNNIKNGLLYLHCEVLFVRDQFHPELLHPRVTLYKSHSFTELWADQKEVIMRLYNHYYYERHNEFWKLSAYKKLPALIHSTNMLCCGEDLGMMPSCVPEVMHDLKILSLEIQRMPKDPHKKFAHPSDAPYLSVCTTGTHDTSTLRAWWEEDRNTTQLFYNQQMGYFGEAPKTMDAAIAEFIIKQHLYSPAMWVILPLQDWLAIDEKVRLNDPLKERINLPSDPDHFWNYRMHISVEDLLRATELNKHIVQLTSIRSDNKQ